MERPRRPELPRVAMHAALLASATALATASASATASPVSALLAAGSRARALFMPLAPALSAAAAGPPSWPALAMAVGVGALAKDAIKHISVRVARQHAGVRVLAGAAGAAGGMASGGVTFGGMAAGGKEAISMLARDLVVPILGARHRERLKGVGLFLASKRATKSLSALVRAATHDPARAAALTRLGEAGGGLGVNGRLAAQAARHMWKFPI